MEKFYFGFFGKKPIGINCDISIKMEEASSNEYQIIAEIPLDSFDSGENKRDMDVKELLQEKGKENLIFSSEVLNQKKIKYFLQQKTWELSGKLMIKSKFFPVTLSVRNSNSKSDTEFLATLQKKISYFEVEPPTMFSGVFMKVVDLVDISIKARLRDIQGFPDSIHKFPTQTPSQY